MKYKIGDMGQSRIVKRAGDIEEGDSRYVAPELLNCDDCEDEIDLKKCDIFSLGMTAFELLTSIYNFHFGKLIYIPKIIMHHRMETSGIS